MVELPYGTIYQRGYVAGQKNWTTYMQRAIAAESEASRLRRALLQIADMDAAALRSDDLGRAARVARDALATLPHPALDRANAGERESEGARCCSYECKASQQDGVLCADDDCDIASGVRSAALPAADPERREGAEGAGGNDGS